MKYRVLRRLAAVVLCLPLLSPAWADEPSAPSGSTAKAVTLLPPEIPVRREAASEGTDSGRVAFLTWSVLALGALAWVAVGWGRRRQRKAGPAQDAGWRFSVARLLARPNGSDLRVISSARLDARHSVHLVAWQHTEYLLGCSEQGLTLLDQRHRASQPGAEEPPAS